MIRNLNIDELDSKLHDYALEVEFIDKEHLLKQLHLFLNFMESQPISHRILERIREDYAELENKIPTTNSPNYRKQKRELLESIKTPDERGALGYFLIYMTFKSERVYNDSYLEITRQWYESRGDYDQWKDDFNTFLFKPFTELVNWYLSESQSYNAKDYFSKKEISEFSEKIDNLSFGDLLNDVRLGQEILFEELQDLKDQLGSLKKKTWGEFLKGKLVDLTLTEILIPKAFSIIVKVLTGEDLKFLN